MELCRGSLSEEIISESLYQTFINKGYPSHSLNKNYCVKFSYNSAFTYDIKFPLIVKTDIPLLITYYDASCGGIGSTVRPLLAMARIVFEPRPIYALLTNLLDFILIDVASGKATKGDETIIPDFSRLLQEKQSHSQNFNEEIEKKIIALHFSFG